MGSSIDAWLMYIYETAHQPKAKYIPSAFIAPSINVDPTGLEVDQFRDLYEDFPKQGTSCEHETIIYVLNINNSHFCLVVFEPAEGTVYLLGQRIGVNETNDNSNSWDTWNSKRVCRNMCLLMGWPELIITRLKTMDWKQNGYDCRPITCQVAQDIILSGMKTEGTGVWKKPSIVCSHNLWIHMAEQVLETMSLRWTLILGTLHQLQQFTAPFHLPFACFH